MDNERLAGQFLGRDAGQIGQPVVGVDDVELILVLHRYRASDHRIVGHLLHKVRAIASGKTELRADALGKILALEPALRLHHLVELLRIHVRDHVRADAHELHLVQKLIHRRAHRLDRNITGADDPCGALILVAGSGRHHKQSLHTIVGQAFDDSVAGRTESSRDVRRKLPSKHQNSHSPTPPCICS